MDSNPSSTLLRKSVISQVHTASDSSEARGNLADLMAHNLQMAKKYYDLQEKSKSSDSKLKLNKTASTPSKLVCVAKCRHCIYRKVILFK